MGPELKIGQAFCMNVVNQAPVSQSGVDEFPSKPVSGINMHGANGLLFAVGCKIVLLDRSYKERL